MKLTLHIGHGKTGSSALQSFLALNESLLLNNGICYPKNHTFLRAKKGHITSSNLAGVKYDEAIFFETSKKVSNHYVFSNESIFEQILVAPDSLYKLVDFFDLELVLYIRNPLDHAFSLYGQGVKRHGFTNHILDWIDSYNIPQRVIDMIKLCENIGVKLNIINYSKVFSIEKSFFEILFDDKSDEMLDQAHFLEIKSVNRSLSRAEYEIQRQFNKFYGLKSSKFISDALVNKAPEVDSEIEYIGDQALERFVKKHKNNVYCINQYLSDDQQLVLDLPKDIKPETNEYQINSKQIAILAESISQQINTPSKPALEDNHANFLRDIALKYDSQTPLSLKDAHYLMGLAHKVRPHGPVIKRKLDHYAAELKK